MSATLPASGLSRLAFGILISSLEVIVPMGTVKMYGTGNSGQGADKNVF
jgi:hypothetical protein